MATDATPAPGTAAVPCISCRRRRVKCDKRLPGCVRCEKSSKPCPGYNRVRSFLDQGATLREKYPDQTPPKPRPGERSGGSLQSILHPSHGVSMSPPSRPVTEDAPVQTQQTSPPVTHSVSGTPTLTDTARTEGSVANSDRGTAGSVSGMDSLSEADFDAIFFDIDPDVYYAQWNNCCGWIPNAHLINDSEDSLAPTTLSWYTPIGSEATPDSSIRTLPEESEKGSGSQSGHDESDGDHQETAHLIQHFSQHISPCLDIFDIQKYFGHAVPVRALESTLLRNLLAALSAKQFAKTRREGAVAVTSLIPTQKWTPAPSCLDQFYSHIPNSEWYYRAASFYDKAITQMMGLLQSLRSGTLVGDPTSARGTPGNGSPRNMSRLLSAAPSPNKRRRTDEREIQYKRALDDLLAAVSIFLLYESLDNHQIEILSHMIGAQYLLQEHLPRHSLSGEGTLRSIDTAQAWRASFWNVAIVDYTQAYIDRTAPRLNSHDQSLWKAAGIPLRRVDHVLVPESLCGLGDDPSEAPAVMTETVACRTLIWIILRALAYAAAEKNNFQPSEESRNANGGTSPPFAPETWHIIRQHLSDWEDLLPDTFSPFATLPRPGNRGWTSARQSSSETSGSSGGSTVTVPFPTLCYSSFMASTASILYHFIQIFLLLHKPLDTSTSESFSRFASRRLAAYRQVSKEIDEHAEKICSICLGQQPGNDASQMHMAQPLHLAGLSFEGHEQRFVLEGLLKGIQRGSGWSTEWIVTSLRGEWGWDAVVPERTHRNQ